MSQPTIFVIDDDASVRRALQRLINAAGMLARAFASAEDFLADTEPPQPDCLVVDLSMPDMSGLQLQQRLIELGARVPVVFISAHDDDQSRRAAIASGAIDFLCKPFEESTLLEVIAEALTHESTPGGTPPGV